jgi:hypothetical protein
VSEHDQEQIQPMRVVITNRSNYATASNRTTKL